MVRVAVHAVQAPVLGLLVQVLDLLRVARLAEVVVHIVQTEVGDARPVVDAARLLVVGMAVAAVAFDNPLFGKY